jgi:hypothetical protein
MKQSSSSEQPMQYEPIVPKLRGLNSASKAEARHALIRRFMPSHLTQLNGYRTPEFQMMMFDNKRHSGMFCAHGGYMHLPEEDQPVKAFQNLVKSEFVHLEPNIAPGATSDGDGSDSSFVLVESWDALCEPTKREYLEPNIAPGATRDMHPMRKFPMCVFYDAGYGERVNRVSTMDLFYDGPNSMTVSRLSTSSVVNSNPCLTHLVTRMRDASGHKMVLNFHPDKCKLPNAHFAFNTIDDAWTRWIAGERSSDYDLGADEGHGEFKSEYTSESDEPTTDSDNDSVEESDSEALDNDELVNDELPETTFDSTHCTADPAAGDTTSTGATAVDTTAVAVEAGTQ